MFEVIVAVSPRGATGDILAHELEVLRPALLYADQVRLLSVSAWMAFGTVGSFAEEDLAARARVLAYIFDGMGGSPDAARHLRRFADLTERRMSGNRQARRRFDKALSASERRNLDGFGALVNEQWSSMAQTLIDAVDRDGSASQITHAADRGVLTFDPLGYEDSGSSFETAGLLAAWVDRVDGALKDPSRSVLFDDEVAGLVRSKINEGMLDLHELSRGHSRQVGVSTGFLSHLPVLSLASVEEILDFRTEVDEELNVYRRATAELSRHLDADLHDPDFRAYVEDYWVNDVEPALAQLSAKAQRNGLMRHTWHELARGAPTLTTALSGLVVAAGMAVDMKTAAVAAGASTLGHGVRALTAAKREHEEQNAELRGNKYVLLYRTAQDLA